MPAGLPRGLAARPFSSQDTVVKDFLLADIGEGIAEVEVLEWFVKAGDHVKEFDDLLRVQSDKATTEITSPYEGEVVDIAVGVGEMAEVGNPLLRIRVARGEGEEVPAENAAEAPSCA